MNMIYVIDFDDVLFDKSGRYTKACQTIGIDFEGPLYQKAKINGIYNPKRHLQLLGKDEKSLEGVLQRSREFLFPGVLEKLGALRQEAKKMFLVSKGDFDYQWTKIKNSDIKKFFDEIYVTSDSKLKIFQENIMPKYGHEKIVFIDDKKQELEEVKKAYSNIVVKNSLS